MKKVAIFYQGAKYYGGIETCLEQIFINTDKNEIELSLISLGDWELSKKLKEFGKNVIVLPFRWFSFHKIFSLNELVRDGGYDLIVSQGMVANFFARLVSYFTKVPNLITIHSDFNYDFHGSKRTLYWLTFKLLEPLTQRYIVVSKYLKAVTEKMGVPSQKIAVIYNGVKEVKPKTKKRGKQIVIGTLGRLHFKKGYHNLIQAVSLLENESFKLLIWGEGEERNHLDSLIKRNHLTEKVELRGFTENIEEALSIVDIYIQPSLEEGFGITVVEAMYAEKPVIITPSGSLPELIVDGKTGLITKGTEPASIAATLKVAIDDPALCRRMGKEARTEALRRFSIQEWVKQTVKTYKEAAK